MRCLIVLFFLLGILTGCATVQEPAKKECVQTQSSQVSQHTQVIFAPNPDVVKENGVDAYTIYSSSPTPSESGVYEYNNYIFVVVVVDYGKEKVASPEAAAMLRSAAMLRKKYNLPEFYDLSCSVIENEDDEENFQYRRVSVFNLSEVKNLASRAINSTIPEKAAKIPSKKTHVYKNVNKIKDTKKYKAPINSKSTARMGTFCGDRDIEENF